MLSWQYRRRGVALRAWQVVTRCRPQQQQPGWINQWRCRAGSLLLTSGHQCRTLGSRTREHMDGVVHPILMHGQTKQKKMRIIWLSSKSGMSDFPVGPYLNSQWSVVTDPAAAVPLGWARDPRCWRWLEGTGVVQVRACVGEVRPSPSLQGPVPTIHHQQHPANTQRLPPQL